MKNLGIVLLSIWLIAIGLIDLLQIRFPASDTVLALLAVAAGVLIMLQGKRLRLAGNLGLSLLGIWLIASGILPLLAIKFPAAGTIMALLAIAAGVLLLLKR